MKKMIFISLLIFSITSCGKFIVSIPGNTTNEDNNEEDINDATYVEIQDIKQYINLSEEEIMNKLIPNNDPYYHYNRINKFIINYEILSDSGIIYDFTGDEISFESIGEDEKQERKMHVVYEKDDGYSYLKKEGYYTPGYYSTSGGTKTLFISGEHLLFDNSQEYYSVTTFKHDSNSQFQLKAEGEDASSAFVNQFYDITYLAPNWEGGSDEISCFSIYSNYMYDVYLFLVKNTISHVASEDYSILSESDFNLKIYKGNNNTIKLEDYYIGNGENILTKTLIFDIDTLLPIYRESLVSVVGKSQNSNITFRYDEKIVHKTPASIGYK